MSDKDAGQPMPAKLTEAGTATPYDLGWAEGRRVGLHRAIELVESDDWGPNGADLRAAIVLVLQDELTINSN